MQDIDFENINLILIRGLPGSGKSTLAREISRACSFVHFENDMYNQREDSYEYNPEKSKKASDWCIANVANTLRHKPVIVSNVFLEPKFLNVYKEMELNRHIVIECHNDYGSEKEIPSQRLQEMRDQWVPYPGDHFVYKNGQLTFVAAKA